MHAALYIVWFAIPTFFFLMALWSSLEKLSGRPKKENPEDFFKQGLFVLGCVLLAVLIETYAIDFITNSIFQAIVPKGVWQVLLLPLILLIAAKLLGPSQDIKIGRAPRPSERKIQSKPRKGAKS
jgi:hypothetical protein